MDREEQQCTKQNMATSGAEDASHLVRSHRPGHCRWFGLEAGDSRLAAGGSDRKFATHEPLHVVQTRSWRLTVSCRQRFRDEMGV